MTEIWRKISEPGFEDFYEVSNLGNVRRTAPGKSTKPGRLLKPFVNSVCGHLAVALGNGHSKKTASVHRMVAMAFLGDPPDGKLWVCHKNDIANQNDVDNLYWGDGSDNAKDGYRNGRDRRSGPAQSNAALSWEEARAMRAAYAAGGKGYKRLAAEFGVGRSVARNVVLGLTYREQAA